MITKAEASDYSASSTVGESTHESCAANPEGPTGACVTSTTVCFLPFNEENFYWRELAARLRQLGVRITAAWTLNELIWALVRGRGVPDIIHIHFMPPFTRNLVGVRRMFTFMCFMGLLRVAGARFVWTVHDLYHPEATWRRADQLIYRLCASLISRIVVHTAVAADTVGSEFSVANRKKIAVVPHGNYIGVYPNDISRDEARIRLQLAPEAVVLLFFGLIRAYKGVPDLIEAYQELDAPSSCLVVAGKPWHSSDLAAVEGKVLRADRIRIIAEFIPNEDVQVYMNACDAVMFPYRNILTSGAIILAMSFGRACVAASVGCIPEVLNERGAFLYDPEQRDGLREALKTAIAKRDQLHEMGAYNLARVRQWTWDGAATETVGIYESVLQRAVRSGGGRGGFPETLQ